MAGGYPEHGCIVADAGYDVTSLRRLTSEAKKQRFLSEGHGEANIDDNPFRPKCECASIPELPSKSNGW
jgi:hypothetical protein